MNAPRLWSRRGIDGDIGLLDLCYCLASHSGERLNLSFQRERLGPESAVLQRVPIADRSPAARLVHPAYLSPPHGRRSAL